MTVPADQWDTWAAPEGFEWTTRPRGGSPSSLYASYDEPGTIRMTHTRGDNPDLSSPSHRRACERLLRWARQHDVLVVLGGNGVVMIRSRGRDVRVPTKFAVYPLHSFNQEGNNNWYQERECPHGDCTHQISTIDIECRGCHRPLECWNCKNGRGAIQLNYLAEGWHNGAQKTACYGCFAGCNEMLENHTRCTNVSVRGSRKCRHHGEFHTCGDCGQERERQAAVQLGNTWYCIECSARRCFNCGGNERTTEVRFTERTNRRLCAPCKTRRERMSEEQADASAEMTAAQLVIPALPGRPVRVVSIEQEFCQPEGEAAYASAGRIAGRLHTDGLSGSAGMHEYHHGNGRGTNRFPAYVERDSTVNGGELIYNRLKLDDPADAEHMRRILAVVKDEQGTGRIKFNIQCGVHIHVDLHGYNYGDCRTLATMFGYLEDPIFRLSASHYGEHRAILNSREYSRPIRKGKWKQNSEFARDFLRHGENHDALSFAHYYRALRNCRCGAVEVGDIQDCTCNLGKCTVEWRTFNGTNNPKKLHAYIALCQSLTAWCQGREVDPDQFESLGLNHEVKMDDASKFGTAERELMEAWKPRLEWMFKNLQFTDAERQNLLYTCKNSNLKHLGAAYLDGLLTLQRVTDNRTLTVPVHALRSSTTQPTQGATPGSAALAFQEMAYPTEPDEDFF